MRAINPDDFCRAAEEKAAATSPYLSRHYGVGVKRLTREEAQRLLAREEFLNAHLGRKAEREARQIALQERARLGMTARSC